ncbi:MAG TPA: HAD family hydrolase [Chthoniobacteraceae bacterium]|nr:HAD family hydrolase [Chthoniobacteraceae bacterium]
MKRAAIFLDRDGTLMEEVDYCDDPSRVRLLPGVAEALRQWKAAGYYLVLATNQSGIGRGYFTLEAYHAVHRELVRQLEEAGAPPLDAAYFCPDAPPTTSPRRKPAPGMLLEAADDLGIDLSASWMIGDKGSDVECGRRAGTRTVLVETGYGEAAGVQADYRAADLKEAARVIAQNPAIDKAPPSA